MIHVYWHYGPVSVLSKYEELALTIVCKEITANYVCDHSITTQYRTVLLIPFLYNYSICDCLSENQLPSSHFQICHFKGS